MKRSRKHLVCWDIDNDGYMHYMNYLALCNEAYIYLRKHDLLVPSWWLAL